MTTNQEMAVRSQPHIPIPGSGSSPATCQHVISIFVSSATLSLLCHRVIVCKQLNSSLLDEWSMSVISDKSSNNVSQLLLLCHSWLTVYVRQKTVSNLSRKLIFLKGRHSYDKGSQLTSHGRVCVPLSVDAVILSCTKHRSPSPDDIHHPLTSHRGVWVSWSVNAHCAHVGGRASLSVLMTSVCVNLKSALLQVISVNKMSNVRSQDEMEYIFLIHFFGGNLV